MKLSPIHRRDFIKRMRKLGWEGPFSGGNHQYMGKGEHNVHIPNPHGRSEIRAPMLKELLRQAEITWEEWLNAK